MVIRRLDKINPCQRYCLRTSLGLLRLVHYCYFTGQKPLLIARHAQGLALAFPRTRRMALLAEGTWLMLVNLVKGEGD